MAKVFGIDLGTTYSCIAYADSNVGQPVVLTNGYNKPITPSVIYFGSETEYLVGELAKANLSTDPVNVCSTVKRQMGNPNWFFTSHGVQRRAEEISALILKQIVADASSKIGEDIKDVVITCPAYFGIPERAATIAAGELAGLNVLKVLPEPTAAACAYGLNTNQKETILVYDLGGGTFDITIIEVDPGVSINVVVTGGDHNLGGKNWDEMLRANFIEKFNFETGNDDDILDDLETAGDLELKVEMVKQTLSTLPKTQVNIVHHGMKAKVEITRDEFNVLTKSLLDKTISLTRETLDDAKKKLKSDVKLDKIILVGGSTRMPQIEERLLQEFQNIPIEIIDPDESVAKGAALVALDISAYNILENFESDNAEIDAVKEPIYGLGGTTAKKPMNFKDVISKSFGVALIVDDKETVKVVNVIPKNTNIPVSYTQRSYTHYADQTSVSIEIYENELSDNIVDIEKSILLGHSSIENLPENLPKGSPVEMIFTITENGILEVLATELTGDNSVNLNFDIKGAMTKEQREEAEGRIGAMVYVG